MTTRTVSWYYKDFEDKTHGPFTASQMEMWWNGKFFDDDLLVRREDEESFSPCIERAKEFSAPAATAATTTPTEREEDEKETAEEGQPPAKKSKGEGEEETSETFFYKDSVGQTFGPFTESQMKTWAGLGFFAPTLLVSRGKDGEFKPLSQHEELVASVPAEKIAQVSAQKQIAAAAFFQQFEQQKRDEQEAELMGEVAKQGGTSAAQYASVGKFNILTGKFQALTNAEYWGRKQLPTDGAGRQIARFMNLEEYQETMRQKKALVESGIAKVKSKKPKEPKKKKPIYSP